MRRFWARSFWGIFSFAFALGGCNVITSYDTTGPGVHTRKQQAAGTYYLPMQKIRVAVADSEFTVGTVTVQDLDAEFEAGINRSPYSSDDITIDFSDDGFLSQISASVTDQTDEVLVDLAKNVALLRELALTNGAAGTFYDFDPFNYDEALQINAVLRREYGGCVEVEIVSGLWSPGCGELSLGRNYVRGQIFAEVRDLPARQKGLFYRRAAPYRVHVVEKGKSKQIVSQFFSNKSPIFRIDIDRRSFVKSDTKIMFKNGAPTKVTVTKESEVKEAASLPFRILVGALNSTTEALAARKNVTTARTELAKAEKARIEAQAALISAITARSLETGRGVTTGDAAAAGLASETLQRNLSACEEIGVEDPDVCAALLEGGGA